MSFSASMLLRVSCPAVTARRTIALDCATWPPISRIEAESSSAALATAPALQVAAAAASAAARADASVRPAEARMLSAVSAMAVVRWVTSARARWLSVSIVSAMARSACFFSAAACPRRVSCSAARRSASIRRCWNTCSVAAMLPTSSFRSTPGISPERSPPARRCIVARSRPTEVTMSRLTAQAASSITSRIAPPTPPRRSSESWNTASRSSV